LLQCPPHGTSLGTCWLTTLTGHSRRAPLSAFRGAGALRRNPARMVKTQLMLFSQPQNSSGSVAIVRFSLPSRISSMEKRASCTVLLSSLVAPIITARLRRLMRNQVLSRFQNKIPCSGGTCESTARNSDCDVPWAFEVDCIGVGGQHSIVLRTTSQI